MNSSFPAHDLNSPDSENGLESGTTGLDRCAGKTGIPADDVDVRVYLANLMGARGRGGTFEFQHVFDMQRMLKPDELSRRHE
jgi:hypothetical protein